MEHAYLELKLAWELFQKAPETLSAPERTRLSQVAARQDGIEQRILASAAATNVVVPEPTLRTRLDEIRQRYPDTEAYVQDLARIGLDEAGLAAAVERDLRVEAVLDRVAAQAEPVSRVDAEIYYRLHPDAFDRPEARQLSHILITYETPQQAADARRLLENLRLTAVDRERFGAAALRHSHCPTALENGRLGTVRRQQLYPQLEAAAFALAEGEISAVVESEIGLHIIRCEAILASGPMPFDEVCAKIVERLTGKRRQEIQKQWIRQLGVARDS